MSEPYIPRADELLLIGTVVNVVGLRGMLRISMASNQPDHLARTQPMLYSHDGKRSFRLRSLAHYKGTLYTATLGGIATRDQADALRNTDLYVMQKDAAPWPRMNTSSTICRDSSSMMQLRSSSVLSQMSSTRGPAMCSSSNAPA